MSQAKTFIGIGTCRYCGQPFPMRSGIQTYCTTTCRSSDERPEPEPGPRTFECADCASEGPAGRAGPLPRRCEPCKRRWDCRPDRLMKKRQSARRRREERHADDPQPK